jgi:signal transduction histidine kinase
VLNFLLQVIFSSLLLEGNFSSIEEKLTSAKALSDQNAKNAMIEELLKSQSELRKAKAFAEKAYEEKSRFFSNASHEIRTPMNGVIGLSELLMSTELSLTQRTYVETIKSSGNFLLNLINDILFAAKMEAEDVNLEVVTFSLRELVHESLFIFEPGAREKGITLAQEFGDDVPDLVSGAPTRLRQVLTNLVSNALRFTDEGRIDIRVHVDRSGLAEGSEELLESGPVRLQFEVRDTGLGIPESVRDKIFEAFTQANDMEALRRGKRLCPQQPAHENLADLAVRNGLIFERPTCKRGPFSKFRLLLEATSESQDLCIFALKTS